MNTALFHEGPYRGEIAAALDTPELRIWLSDLGRRTAAASATKGQGGARVYSMDAPVDAAPLPLLIKAQGRLPFLKNLDARRRGTAAQRAWRVALRLAERGVGTPEPVAWVERWDGSRSEESYFITRRLEPVTNFRDELRHLLRHDPDAGRVLGLLEAIAPVVRAMHDAGVQHRDLGNQNILLQRGAGGEWAGVYLIDLNRALISDTPLSNRQRALDMARLYLPTDLLRVFCEMYFGSRAPADFTAALRGARRRFRLHSLSRQIRHPIRQARVRRDPARRQVYPPPRDIWLWDEKSAQPVNGWARKERNKLYPISNHALIAGTMLKSALRIRREYGDILPAVFKEQVAMKGRWGMSVEPRPATWAQERALLPSGSRAPLLIRLYRHKGARQWDFAVQAGRELAADGHPVGFALCQDRRALLEPAAWAAMCERIVPQVAPFADWIEAGHAINRVKWGLWSLREYRCLVEPMQDLKASFPNLRLMGPAGIDFEYPQVLAALSALPSGFRFDALSHHLYVDRRGAPENPQGRFASLEKFVLARAVARASGKCEDRLIVSEVNWPLADTGVYSPVCSPYLHPGQRVGAPNVGEDTYARFMIRYLLQAACSGFVERVYWWRLAAHGFGLVDEQSDPWRLRPAYHAWVHLVNLLGEAKFLRNISSGVFDYIHLFERPDGELLAVGYAWRDSEKTEIPFTCGRAERMDGAPLDGIPDRLAPDPVYFRQVRLAK